MFHDDPFQYLYLAVKLSPKVILPVVPLKHIVTVGLFFVVMGVVDSIVLVSCNAYSVQVVQTKKTVRSIRSIRQMCNE